MLLARAFRQRLDDGEKEVGGLIEMAVRAARDFLVPASLPLVLASVCGAHQLVAPLYSAPEPGIFSVRFADETYQRESRKGSREWVRHFADPKKVAPPPAQGGRTSRRRG